MNAPEINKRKVQAYNLLKQINQTVAQAKELQGDLQRLEGEINELEEADALT
jgi:hypothetical protein